MFPDDSITGKQLSCGLEQISLGYFLVPAGQLASVKYFMTSLLMFGGHRNGKFKCQCQGGEFFILVMTNDNDSECTVAVFHNMLTLNKMI